MMSDRNIRHHANVVEGSLAIKKHLQILLRKCLQISFGVVVNQLFLTNSFGFAIRK